jgi:pimeloyl-ACP methyl ester carboxylesterase
VLGGAHPFAEGMGPFRELISGGLERWVAVLEGQTGRRSETLAARIRAGDTSALRALLTSDRPDNAASLGAITMPCTLFAGTADPRLPLVERAARQLPHAAFIPLPGANHIQAYLEARAILEIVERHVDAAEQQAPLPAARPEH